MKDCGVIVFVKEPLPGKVKTRLAATIGDQAAADAYRCLVETLLANIGGFVPLTLACSPADACDSMAGWLGPEHHYVPQSNGDLGERMFAAFSDAFASGFKKAILIGSDCPEIRPGDLESAAHALDDHDVVLGPANDGGYWLIGMKSPENALFRNISWSSERVLQETLDRCRKFGLKPRLLTLKTDIDTVDEWTEFKKRNFPVKGFPRSTD